MKQNRNIKRVHRQEGPKLNACAITVLRPTAMPVTEKEVGITELLGSHKPFRAILKQSIDDFVVNEVLLSGKVARLTKLAQAPAPVPRSDKRKQPYSGDTNAEQSTEGRQEYDDASLAELPFDQLEGCFSEASKKIASESIRAMLKSNDTGVFLPVCTDKQKRKEIHEWVRNNLPAFVTDTCERKFNGEKGQAVRLRKRKACRPWKRRRTDRRDEDHDRSHPDAHGEDTYDPREDKDIRRRCGEGNEGAEKSAYVGRNTYVQFVLWKRNKDTLEALNILSKMLRIPSNGFTFAGTKDKRAVTTQLIQVRGIPEHRLAYVNRTAARRDRGQRSIAVGNVEVLPRDAPKALGLGDLLGNRFTLALRDLDIESPEDRKNVEAAVDSVRTRGFVNYFGLQRFGSGVSGTHETGFAFLRGDFEDVCRRILLPLKMSEWEQQGAEGIRPERQRLNDALENFTKKGIRAKELLEALPRWMHIETALAKSFAHDEEHGREKYDYRAAFEQLPRNLRRMYGHAVQSYLWNIMASERIRASCPDDPSRMHAIKGDLILVDPDEKQEVNFETEVRAVTEEEERTQSISIFRVLIPVLGSEVSLPEGIAYGEVAKAVLEEQKVDLKNRLSSDYGMKGTYRSLLAQPKDVEVHIASYSNPTDTLIPSAVVKSEKTEKDVPARIVEGLDANGCTPEERMVQAPNANNDKMEDSERHQIPITLVSDEEAEPCENEKLAPDNSDVATTKNALVIAFTLGRGEFATMLVRELTRKDSSTLNQKAMQDATRRQEGA